MKNTLRTIQELLLKGDKIGAIKEYRNLTGNGLKESKDAVEHFENTGSWSLTPEEMEQRKKSLQENTEDIETLVQQGKKVEAIKKYREIHGVGLKEAKEAIENTYGI